MKEVRNMKKKNKKIKDNKIKDLLSNQKGVALITVLIFIFLMVTFVVALMAMTSNDIKLSSMQRDSTKAFYQADGGIEKAIWYLNSSQDNPAGLDFEGDLPRGGVSDTEYYDVKVSPTDLGPPEIKTLISTGTLEGGGRYNQDRVVEVKLKKGVSPSPGLNYDYAVLTDDDMDINGGITIHGNIHSNGNIDISNPDVFNLYGSATANGYNNYPGGSIDVPKKTFPIIDWDFFRELVINSDDPEIENENGNGKYYGSDNSVIWDDPLTLYGVHFVDGDVIVKSDIILQNATIFAAGTIRVLGSGDVYFNNDIKVNPLALIAMGDIIIGGGVHGAGIIQTTGGNFTNNGNVDIDEGAIYANVGRFNGGGGKEFNVRYSTDLLSIFVSGTGIPVWVKISWREL
jgi:hypothetical protein